MFLLNVSDPEELVKRYFSFLTDQYSCIYSNYIYTSKKVRIIIELGHKTPGIFIAKIGEPDFTKILFDRFIRYCENRDLDIFFPDHSLEHNIKYMADIFKKYAPRIVDEVDDWWLPVHQYEYEYFKDRYKKSGQMGDFLDGFREYYDYLKSKGIDLDN